MLTKVSKINGNGEDQEKYACIRPITPAGPYSLTMDDFSKLCRIRFKLSFHAEERKSQGIIHFGDVC
jgi:hypothetical protein